MQEGHVEYSDANLVERKVCLSPATTDPRIGRFRNIPHRRQRLRPSKTSRACSIRPRSGHLPARRARRFRLSDLATISAFRSTEQNTRRISRSFYLHQPYKRPRPSFSRRWHEDFWLASCRPSLLSGQPILASRFKSFKARPNGG